METCWVPVWKVGQRKRPPKSLGVGSDGGSSCVCCSHRLSPMCWAEAPEDSRSAGRSGGDSGGEGPTMLGMLRGPSHSLTSK